MRALLGERPMPLRGTRYVCVCWWVWVLVMWWCLGALQCCVEACVRALLGERRMPLRGTRYVIVLVGARWLVRRWGQQACLSCLVWKEDGRALLGQGELGLSIGDGVWGLLLGGAGGEGTSGGESHASEGHTVSTYVGPCRLVLSW